MKKQRKPALVVALTLRVLTIMKHGSIRDGLMSSGISIARSSPPNTFAHASARSFRKCRFLFPATTVVLLSFLLFYFPLKELSPHGLTRSPEAPIVPPPLLALLRHARRPSQRPLPDPPDWKRPHVLTAHVQIVDQDNLRLTIFTTGTDAGWFHRDLKLAGCAIGDVLYASVSVQPEMVSCNVKASQPVNGAVIAAVLKWDEALEWALERPRVLEGVQFTIFEEDVRSWRDRTSEKGKERRRFRESKVGLIRSNLTWNEGLIDKPSPRKSRYELCMMTQVQHDAHLLKEWMAFHRRLGVDKFYIYDNNAPVDISAFADQYAEVVYWPWARSQSQAFSHFLLASKVRCKFVAFFDVDEYVLVGDSGGGSTIDQLKSYIRNRRQQGYAQVIFPQLQMANSGYARRPRGALPELYTRVKIYQRGFGVKPVVETDVPWTSHRVNRVFGNKGIVYQNMTIDTEPQSLNDNAILVHFEHRSWEEFVAKAQAGSPSVLGKYIPPVRLNESNPQDWYLTTDKTSELLSFRDYWRPIMRSRDHGEITLTWESGPVECRQAYCPRCLWVRSKSATCSPRKGQ